MASRQAAGHRRKRRTNVAKNSPFPIPISTLTQVRSKQNYWFYYTGTLRDDDVEVTHSGDIHFLYTMGFFGRGLMSRGAPELHHNLPNVNIPTSGGETDVIKVMRRRMYLRHKQWQKAAEKTGVKTSSPDAEDLTEFDSDIDYADFKEQFEQGDVPCAPSDFNQDGAAHGVTNMETGESPSHSNQLLDNDSDRESWDRTDASWEASGVSWGNAAEDVDFWEANGPSNRLKAIVADEWENKEADHDFWGTQDSTNITDSKTANEAESFPKETKGGSADSITEGIDSNSNCFKKALSSGSNDMKTNCVEHDRRDNRDQDDECSPRKKPRLSNGDEVLALETEATADVEEDFTNPHNKVDSHINEMCSGNQQDCESVAEHPSVVVKTSNSLINDQPLEHACEDDSSNVLGACSSQCAETLPVKSGFADLNTGSDYPSESDLCGSETLPYHPCCKEEDPEGDYLVIEDSDCDDRLTTFQIKRTSLWRPVRKKDVYPYVEPLILSLEEAFFLSYGLGCLTVRDDVNSAMSLTDMWCEFCRRRQRFLPCYVAYHYFRSKGWVPRSGVVFGVDFIVYRVGPPFYHSSYSVIIKVVYEGDYEEVADFSNRKLTWTSFAGLNRVTEHVAKTLMFCYVIMPRNLTKEELRSPLCLAKFKIKLQLVNRWVSSQEREKDKDADMP